MISIQQFAIVGIRLVGIWVLARAIDFLPGLASVLTLRGPEHGILIALAQMLLLASPVLIGVLLLVYAPLLARRICPPDAAPSAAPRERAGDPGPVIIAAAGLLIVGLELPGLIYQFHGYLQASGQVPGDTERGLLVGFLAQSVAVAFGAVVFLGARFWHGLFRRLREFGLSS